MAALLDAARDPAFPAEIVLVLANRPDAGGLGLAAAAGIPTAIVDHRPFKGDRSAHERAIDAELRTARAEIICLAGYMRLLTPFLVDAWAGRMLNIHPSLLPAFPGLDGIGQAWNAGVPEAGCTVHWVNAEIDGGAHLGQTRVAREPADTLETFAQKIHAAEHALLPAVIARLSETLS